MAGDSKNKGSNRPQEGLRVLVVDDEQLYRKTVVLELERQGHRCRQAGDVAGAMEEIANWQPDLVLLDHRLPDQDGIEAIPRIRAASPSTTVVVMTAYHAIPNAVAAIRAGAEDYIVKEPTMDPIVERVAEIERERRVMEKSSGPAEEPESTLTGDSPAIRKVIAQIEKIARSPETTVLITGETGSGKEVAARMLHRLSRPPSSPFVAVDCASLPATLTESIIFGHERGAFTGAEHERAGAFENAGEGTLFLDEIGELGPLQAKLLRVLESRTFTRVGGTKQIPLRARVVAATNQDLAKKVEQGQFRLDLYQRLCVFPIEVPPLRKRKQDIIALADRFVGRFALKLGKDIRGLDKEAAQRLCEYDFPGNVRELKNIVERAVILAEDKWIQPRHLPRRVLSGRRAPIGPAGESMAVEFRPGVDSLKDVERRLILQALERTGGVKSDAAKMLGLSRFQLGRRLERYGISTRGAFDKEKSRD